MRWRIRCGSAAEEISRRGTTSCQVHTPTRPESGGTTHESRSISPQSSRCPPNGAKRLATVGPHFSPRPLVKSVSDKLALERRGVHIRRAGENGSALRWGKDGVGGNAGDNNSLLLLRSGLGHRVCPLLYWWWRRRRRSSWLRGGLILREFSDLEAAEGDFVLLEAGRQRK